MTSIDIEFLVRYFVEYTTKYTTGKLALKCGEVGDKPNTFTFEFIATNQREDGIKRESPMEASTNTISGLSATTLSRTNSEVTALSKVFQSKHVSNCVVADLSDKQELYPIELVHRENDQIPSFEYLSKGYKYDHCDFRIALLSRKTANSCTCDDCSLDTCICTNSSSAYSASVKDTYLFDRFNVRYTGFEINECHENCSCQPHTCPNRMIGLYDELDRWKIQKKIKIEITDRYGWALIAAEYIFRKENISVRMSAS